MLLLTKPFAGVEAFVGGPVREVNVGVPSVPSATYSVKSSRFYPNYHHCYCYKELYQKHFGLKGSHYFSLIFLNRAVRYYV